MISAVIPLPNFLTQYRNMIVAPKNDIWEDSEYVYTRARNLLLGRGQLFKYKLVLAEFVPQLIGSKEFLKNPRSCLSETEIVIISTDPIDHNYDVDPHSSIYPIYGKCCGQTFVFPQSIERLLRAMSPDGPVCDIVSPLQFVVDLQPECTGIPMDNNFFAYRAPPLYWHYTLEDTVNQMLSDDLFDGLVAELINPSVMFPKFFMIAAQAHSWYQLREYVDIFADRTNNARNAIVGCAHLWPEIGRQLYHAGKLLTTPNPNSRIDLLLYYAQLIGPDFFVDVDLSNEHFDIPDMYLNHISLTTHFEIASPQRSERIKEFVRVLCNAVNQNWSGKKVRIHKTYAEDIIVADLNSGETLLYIDLVWWTIASSNSIINQFPKEVLR